MKPSRHAALAAQYAQEMAQDAECWKNWQLTSNGQWIDCKQHPNWSGYCEYRRKPKTITINGFEVPEPMRVAPPDGTIYWVATICGINKFAFDVRWGGGAFDREHLSRGICHLSKENAELHTKAVLSFSEVKE